MIKKLLELFYDFYHSPKTFLIAFLITGYIANQLAHFFLSIDPYTMAWFFPLAPFVIYLGLYFPVIIFVSNSEEVFTKLAELSFLKGKFGKIILNKEYLYIIYLIVLTIYGDYLTEMYDVYDAY